MLAVPLAICARSQEQITSARWEFSTSLHVRSRLSLGWPRLEKLHDKLVCRGPLPVSCYCAVVAIPLLIGVVDSDGFITSVSYAVGPSFGNSSLSAVGVSPLVSVSLASGIGWLRSTYEAWKVDTLSKSMLADIAGTDNTNAYFSESQNFSSTFQFVFLLESFSGAGSGLSAAVVFWPLCPPVPKRPCFLSSSALTLSLTHEEAPGPSETEGHVSSLVAGASPGFLSARCVAFTVLLLIIMSLCCPFNN